MKRPALFLKLCMNWTFIEGLCIVILKNIKNLINLLELFVEYFIHNIPFHGSATFCAKYGIFTNENMPLRITARITGQYGYNNIKNKL